MRGLRVLGLSLLAVLLLCTAQAGAAKPQPNTVKRTAAPIGTLAMSGPRVAFASGGWIYVWNVETGASSVVKGTYSNAAHTINAHEIAILGNRVAWIKSEQLGNTELPQRLFTAYVGGSAHKIRAVLGATNTYCGSGGSQIGGLVGSRTFMAVSTWKWDYRGLAVAHRRLNLVTPTDLRTIATGPSAVASVAADGDHIAVVPLPSASAGPDYCEVTPATTVGVYSVSGKLLRQIDTGPVVDVALKGNDLVVLTPPPGASIEVYDWTTGSLLHTWPAVGTSSKGSGPNQPAHVRAYGRLVLYSVYSRYTGRNETLHLLDLTSGKDVVVATVKGFGNLRAWTIGARGLVYVVNHGHRPLGSLVFVPTVNLRRLLAG